MHFPLARHVMPPAIGAVLLTLVSCAPVTRPTAQFSQGVLGDAEPVDLSPRLQECTNCVTREFTPYRVRIRYPKTVRRDDAIALADMLRVGNELTGRYLQGSETITIELYYLPVQEIPKSYRIRMARSGRQWERATLAAILVPHDQIDNLEVWDQVGTQVHEATHSALELLLSSCPNRESHLRWLEEGICTLTEGRFLESAKPAAYAAWKDRSLWADPAQLERLFNGDILHWPTPDPEHESTDSLTTQAAAYVAAFYVVREIDQLDSDALVHLVKRVRSARPQDVEALKSVFSTEFGRTLEEVMHAAKQAADQAQGDTKVED